MKEPDFNEGDEVDIVTVEKDAFSDSDMSQGEVCFLPAIPCPDFPEQQEKCVGSSSKLMDSNQSGSPLSEEAGQNGQVNHASSPLEGNIMNFLLFLSALMLVYNNDAVKFVNAFSSYIQPVKFPKTFTSRQLALSWLPKVVEIAIIISLRKKIIKISTSSMNSSKNPILEKKWPKVLCGYGKLGN